MAISAARTTSKADSPGRKPISFPTSSGRSEAQHHPRRHYGRRKGWKLRPHQAGLLETLLPPLLITPQPGLDPLEYFADALLPLKGGGSSRGEAVRAGGGHEARSLTASGQVPSAVALAKADARERIHSPALTATWLEIGFGGGEHLAWQAEQNPNTGIIGAEPFVAGMAKLLSKIEGLSLHNIRLYTEDARDIIAALPDASLSRIFLLFPDPWPKTRHHKRRFIQMEMLDQLARVMRGGAELRFATDDQGNLAHALERLMAHADFIWTAQTARDWQARPADWPETRYEAKALSAGRSCTYLRFLRR